MRRAFIELQGFLKRWHEVGLTEADLLELETHMCNYPESGDVVSGIGGLRKLRVALSGRGKSGSRELFMLILRTMKRYIYLINTQKMKRLI